MKIWIATTSPRPLVAGYAVWNARTIDEFEERFVRDDMLVIGDFRLPISNFVKHNQYIGTFETTEHIRCAFVDILLALTGVDAPPGRGSFHNVKVAIIHDDQNPLRNPKAEAARRADQERAEREDENT